MNPPYIDRRRDRMLWFLLAGFALNTAGCFLWVRDNPLAIGALLGPWSTALMAALPFYFTNKRKEFEAKQED